MPAIFYPITLPGPDQSSATPTERRRTGENHVRSFATSHRDYHARETVSLTFNATEAAAFRAFWLTDLARGGRWFVASWPGLSGFVPRARKFIGTPQWEDVGFHRFRVSVECWIRGLDEAI